MLDIALIRRDPDRVRESLVRRGLDPSPVGEVLRYDEEYRSALTAVERAKAEKNRLSASIAEAPDKAAAARELRPNRSTQLSRSIAELEERARSLSPFDEGSPLRALLDNMPNLLDDVGSRGYRRERKRRGAPLGRAASLRLRAEAALGARRSARNPRFRPRGKAFGKPFRRAQRPRRATRSRARLPSSSIERLRADTSKSHPRCSSRATRCGRPGS